MYCRDEADNAAVDISLAQIVVSKRPPDLSRTISRIFRDQVRQSPLRVLSVVDRRATPVTAIIDIGFRDTRVRFIAD